MNSLPGTIFACTVILIIWLRGPLSDAAKALGDIAAQLRALRELAEKGRRS